MDKIFLKKIIQAIHEQDDNELFKLIVNYIIYSTVPISAVVVLLMYFATEIVGFLFPVKYDRLPQSIQVLSPFMISINSSRL